MTDEPKLVSARVAYDREVVWVCVACAVSDRAWVQPRCPRCQRLMIAAN